MARLPRGVITGAAPKPVQISPGLAVAGHVAAANAADKLSDTFLRIQQADDNAKFNDAVTNAKLRLKEYVEKASTISVDSDTGKPAYETAAEDFENFARDLQSEAQNLNASNPAKQAIAKALDTLIADKRIDIDAMAEKQFVGETQKRLEITLDRMVSLGDFAEAKSLVNEEAATRVFTPAEREELLVRIDEKQGAHALALTTETAMGGFNQALAAGKGAEYIALVQAEPVLADSKANEKLVQRMISKMDRAGKLERILNADTIAAEAKARGIRNLNLREEVAAGTAGREEIRAAFDAGDVSISEAASLERAAEKFVDNALEFAQSRKILAAGLPLDPKNSNHRKAVEVEFQEILNASGAGLFDPATRTQVAALIKTGNIIPESLNSMFRSVMLKGTPEMQVALTDLADRLGPAAKLPPDSRAFASIVNDAVRGGMAPEQATEYASEWVFETPEATKKQLQSNYATESADNIKTLDGFIDDNFDSLFSAQPEAPLEMQADFNVLTESYYQRTRDIDKARQLALQDLQTQWGRTDVNGSGEMTRFPIEQMHGAWAIDDVKAEMDKLGVTEFRVESDEITARTEGGSYGLYTLQNGMPSPVFVEIDGVAQVARYTPPAFDQTDDFKKELDSFFSSSRQQEIKRSQAKREAARDRQISKARREEQEERETPEIRFSF